MLDGEGQVGAVLLGQGRDGNFDIGHVHALAVGNDAADFGRTQDAVGLRTNYPQLDLAIVDEQPLPFRQDAEQFRVGQLHPRLVTGFRVAVEGEVARMADHRLAVLERAHAQFRTLQVGEDGDGAAHALLQLADRLDDLRVAGPLAVAHVDAEGVGARRATVSPASRACCWPGQGLRGS
jgi:hypothetical protein